MAQKDNLYTSEQAREKLMSGIRRASEAVSITMGTAGANSILEDIRHPGYMISNDGASILERIHFADPLEELGRRILLEAVGRNNKANGDGSSSATLLTSSLLDIGMKYVGEVQPMEIKSSLEACLPLIEASLKSQRKELVDGEGNIDYKLLKQTASIAGEDESIGEMITDIYKVIGRSGIINWEVSKSGNDFFEIGTGIKIDGATYASRWMCDDEGGGPGTQAIMNNPYVLLAHSKITSETELEKVFGELTNHGVKELVIFCDEMEEPVLASLIRARLPNSQGGVGFRFLVIKMPVVFNDLWWEDLVKASGGRMISKASGIKMKDVSMDFLGKFGKITATPNDVFIDGIEDLSKHILALKVDGSDEALARSARLNTKTARYYVGGHSESSIAYRRLKIEDSICSAYSAMQEGVVVGGGIALKNIIPDLPDTMGGLILKQALRRPFEQIVKNANRDVSDIESKLKTKTDGFNSKMGKVEDLVERGIVNAFSVEWGAIKNAIGVAAGVLTAGSVVLLPREEELQSTPQSPIMTR